MAVFTAVTLDDLTEWLTQFPLGQALAIDGIASGIEHGPKWLQGGKPGDLETAGLFAPSFLRSGIETILAAGMDGAVRQPTDEWKVWLLGRDALA